MDEESGYFYQLIGFVVDLGTETLLKILQKQVPNGQTLDKFIKTKQSTIRTLEKRKVLNDMQMKVLNSTTIDSTKLDISLLFTLIRNLTNVQPPTAGWDAKIIPLSEVSTGAFLVRLKNVRNEAIAHKAKASLTETEFEKFWKETEQCLIGLAKEISPDAELQVSEKIGELKVKSVDLNDKLKVDKLLKWYFEESSAKMEEMATQMKDINHKMDKQPDLSSELRDVKNTLDLMQKEVKSLSLQQTMSSNLPSFPSQTFSEGSTVSDGNGSQEVSQIQAAVNEWRSYYFKMMMCMYTGEVDPSLDQVDGSGYRNPNAFTDDEIKEYSEELGADWEIFAIYLGYRQQQIDILKDTYPRQIETLLLTMLRKWHHEVAGCENENPRELLAAAFVGIRDNLTASKILGGRERLPEMKKLKPKPETAKKIKQIKFATKPHFAAAMLQMGAMGAMSYSGGQSSVGFGNTSQNSGLSSIAGAQATPALLPTSGPNICRAEGINDQMDCSSSTSLPSSSSGQFKKQDDDTLSQRVVGTLNEYMKSVGCLIITYGNRGTCFRVGEKYVITALHVVENLPDEMYSECIQLDPDYSVPAVFVNFHEIPDVPPSAIYRLKPPCYRDSDLDIAILELEDNNIPLPAGIPICGSEEPKYKVDIIGYGHTGSNKKHLDPNCPVLPVNHDQVDQARKILDQEKNNIRMILRCNGKDPSMVQKAFDGFDNPSCFLLNSFFEHGASGGPAIDHSNGNCRVIGIYTQGFPAFYFDLPPDRQERYKRLRFEMCTKSSSLYERLAATNMGLACEIFGK